jgi:hypothetical protein
MLTAGPALVTTRPGQTLIGDKNYYGTDFEAAMAGAGSGCCGPPARPSRRGAGAHLFKPLRQIIESVNDTSRASSAWNSTAATPPAA